MRDDCNNCLTCLKGKKVMMGNLAIPASRVRMIVCPDCGNKRCPKATDHEFACTRSNASGQPGSAYKGYK